jgi:predicted choloylglycine hydrolase
MTDKLNCFHEEKPGAKWQQVFNKTWPLYHEWFLIEGIAVRPGYLTSYEELAKFMPELMPIYHQLCTLAGGGDLAARYLSMYCPPPYLAACSQLAWIDKDPVLIRNYDYNPDLFEGVLMSTNWLQPVVGMSDCNWGLLDGINASGLSVSLAFGGKQSRGVGFGIPIVIRYLLETCHSVAEACERLKYLPVHMAYNITMVDKYKDFSTVYVGPGQVIQITKDKAATNHQHVVEWENYALMTSSVERIDTLIDCINAPHQSEKNLIGKFLEPPLYVFKPENSFCTLYTSVYRPLSTSLQLFWGGHILQQSIGNFTEKTYSKKQNVRFWK